MMAGDMMWDALSEDAQQDWQIHGAAHDPKILATMQLLMTHEFSLATRDYIFDDLERQIANQYGVLPERTPEVFGKAQALVWQEMTTDGEA